jgi:hypothetical protein
MDPIIDVTTLSDVIARHQQASALAPPRRR